MRDRSPSHRPACGVQVSFRTLAIMSNRKNKLNPFTETLYSQKPAGLVARRMERTADFEPEEPQGAMSACVTAPHIKADWMNDPERRKYRHKKIEECIDELIHKMPEESFDGYLERCFSTANLALNHANKATVGDEFPNLVDRWVCRFVKGLKLLSRKTGVGWTVQEETNLFNLIREECDILSAQDVQFVEDRTSVRTTKRSWERDRHEDETHPTDYRENIGGNSRQNIEL